jgi:hypothetical protein
LTAEASTESSFIHEGPPLARRTFADAIRLVVTHPRACLGPLYAVQVPAALFTAVGTLALYATLFRDKGVVDSADVFADGDRAQQLWFTLSFGVEALFAQVARGGAIVSIAAAARGKPVELKRALDPAFTRMGGLILIVVVMSLGAGALAFTLVGIPVAIYLAIRLAIVFDVYMLEGLAPGAAVGRTWSLTRGRLLALTGTLAFGLLAAVPVVIFASALSALSAGDRVLHVSLIASLGVVQSLLVIPAVGVFTALTTLFYLNLKANEHGRYTA